MADSSKSTLGAHLLTGAISLGTGIAVVVFTQYLTEKKVSLEYETIASSLFDGKTQKTAILQVNITNAGKKEIENITSNIAFTKATIIEPKLLSAHGEAHTLQHKGSQLEAKSNYLNPGETVSIQMLIAPVGNSVENPEISIRSKGITATQRRDLQPRTATSFFWTTAPALLGMLATLAAFLLTYGRVFRTILGHPALFSDKHLDDQRQVMAYLLGAHGLYPEAERVRTLANDTSYWAQSDGLAELCIESGDKAKISKGINCLRALIEYADINQTYGKLIHFNIARMCVAADDLESAKKHLALARSPRHEVVEKRIRFSDALSKLLDKP